MTAPSTSGIPNTKNTTGAPDRSINLRDIFVDAETSSNALIYTVQSNSNPGLFTSPPSINPATGVLLLDYHATATGTANLTIRATDGESLFADATFTVSAIAAAGGNDIIAGGDGEDFLDGAAGDDSISGLNLNDTLKGGSGNDTLVGGTGNDEYSVDVATDVVTESSNEGTDIVKSDVTYTLGSNVENLILNTGADNGTGNTLDNTITGNGSVNIINGGLGSDTMAGDAGIDTYIVDNTGDVINESATPLESDLVKSTIDYTLGANVERLTLMGTAVNGTGNAANNTITGNVGANTLSGGTGSDTMTGSEGNDTYVVDALGDSVIEDSTLDGEIDTVKSSVPYDLSASLDTAKVENLELIGGATNGTGNALNNHITGNTVNNTLDGGVGNDTLFGGAGNDIYVINTSADVVNETSTSSAEIDTVRSSLTSYALGANVENLELQVGAVNGTGNELDNTLKGNGIGNQLDGASGDDTIIGGAGIDTMNGESGSDTYEVTEGGDLVSETSSNSLDIDTVKSSVTYTLGLNVEKLELIGAGAIGGTGNADPNTILGNDSDNLINGADGKDTMTGGKGNDTYIVNIEGDVVAENSTLPGEIDTVKSAVSYTLGSNVEKLELTGTAVSGTGNTLNNTITGNASNNTLSGGTGNDAMTGGLGDDTYVVDATGDVVTEALSEGTDTVQSSVTETLDANVENLTLTGVTAINGIGNALGNTILGNSAANEIDGGIGNDIMTGGTGNDTYVVDAAGDVVTETSTVASETDLIKSSVDFNLGTNGANVEKLELTGSAVNGTGNNLSNYILGNASNNTLSGLLGSDTMKGAAGNDTYVVDATGDLVDESTLAGGAGTDEVQSSVTYNLGSNLEKLTLTGSSAINATGNEVANIITGNSGNNILSGGTETAPGVVDNLIGGAGDDTYLIGTETSTDTITENLDEGNDTVSASKTHGLGSNLENLILTGNTAINGAGNVLNNKLTGNTAANALNGLAGNDTMIGGTGGDYYTVDVAGDVVQETSTVVTEIDTVTSAVTYDLSTNVVNGTNATNIENLTLTGLLGTENLDGTGNALSNKIIGNAGDNKLDGKSGSDTMTGGGGNDTYTVDATGDIVAESALSGADKVKSSVTYTLSNNVEDLTLTLKSGNTPTLADNINATGNDLVNTITGNAGANILSGGAGTDTLIGDTGNDTYIVDATLDVIQETSALATEIDNVSSSVTYGLGSNLENLTLTGTAAINGDGNGLDNKITGNTAANTLAGGVGKDSMTGGTGNDIYVVDNPLDVITETSALTTEKDTVQSSVNFILGANVEDLTLTGTAISGTGNTLNNTILGNTFDNLIDGKTGNDTMAGGDSSDTYAVDATLDVINESAGGGTADAVNSSATYVLGANVENLTLTGATAINGTGNALTNNITGNTAANLIDGLGGIDTMAGGTGNDTYTVDVTGDVVTETSVATTEIDTVKSSANYTLGTNVENLTLTRLALQNDTTTTTGLSGTGNTSKNTIIGTTVSDTLSGGTDNDTMIGGTGNDTYTVDATLDVVTETSALAAEIDSVNSSATFTLGANIENLTLTGSGDINGTGNTLNNTIVGNSGINILSGGTGNDAMTGGAANDIYVVDAVGDVVTELAAGGTGDTVQSSVTEILDAEVENLTLTGISAINGTGNALNNAITGNTAANTLDGLVGNDTMTGGTGNDIYVVDATGDVVTESSTLLTEIDTVKSSINYDLGTSAANVEKLELTGTAANGSGNALNNTITGNGAANTLSGSTGNDTMIGGTGNDTYVVDVATDVVTETSNLPTEIDTVQSSITYTLGTNVENLTLTGAIAINGTGNTLNNTIIGNDGINTLSGSTGNDAMTGGLGDDTYVVDAIGDVVTELAPGGTDTVQSSVTETLDANVEKLTLTGTNSITGIGNTGNNTIKGNSAANTLDGLIGNDTMEGLAGNDIYVVDAAGDVVTEVAAGGTDTVQSSITDTLDAEVENLTLTGTTGISGSGNALNNTITGNTGNNTLSGLGGNDTMTGGTGNDTYVVDATGDVVTEAANTNDANGNVISGGTDTVESSVTETLDANVENLTLTGTAVINGTGNVLNNTITGNIADNILSGGAGVDNLIGGAGNDTYIVDSTTDTITDSAGTDLVSSSVDYTLGTNLDNLTLTGTSVINGTGNSNNNILIGNTAGNSLSADAGNDTLTGGAGNDTLTGGAGNDKFIYDSNAAYTSSSFGIDRITDFVSGTDKIVLDTTTFTVLNDIATQFAVVGTDAAASTSTAFIVYSTDSDNLFYNQNGATAGYGTGGQFATLAGIATTNASDFELQV